MNILVANYPDFLAGHQGNVIIWKDGTHMPFDDGIQNKSFPDLVNQPSIKDMFYTPYKSGRQTLPPALNIDPGRVRNEAFFLKMYGDCRKGGEPKGMVDVIWLPHKWGKKLRVTKINRMADALTKVSLELDRLPSKYDIFLFPSAGTVNCRVIAGTHRLSAHATGTAIDISTARTNYWQWEKPDGNGLYPWKNAIPQEVVDVFERHGFIWGGKWYHYDTMHFEYRPELIAAGERH